MVYGQWSMVDGIRHTTYGILFFSKIKYKEKCEEHFLLVNEAQYIIIYFDLIESFLLNLIEFYQYKFVDFLLKCVVYNIIHYLLYFSKVFKEELKYPRY